MGLIERIVIGTLPLVPTPVMRRLSARYIAGETLEQAMVRLRELSSGGYTGVLDVLGEDVEGEEAARAAAHSYELAGEQLAREGLDCYLSVKPTHVGLRLSEDLCFDNYDRLATSAGERGLFVRVEMEDHTTTDGTLRVFARLAERHRNVGIVLQSRLKRTPADIEALPEGVDVRLVKGIYLEPEEIAYTEAQPIRDAFLACAESLWARGHRVAIASHDEHLAARLLRAATDRGVARDRYYFEVLLGVQERLWKLWSEQGHEVRVYVPYGPEWRAYSTRRLRRNPQILQHVLRNMLSRG